MRPAVRHRCGSVGSPRLPWPRARSSAAAGAAGAGARCPHRRGGSARLVAALLLLHSVSIVGCMPGGGGGAATGAPENVTVIFFNATTVSVTWVAPDRADKYDVTYKPTDASYRVVALVAGNLRTVTLHNLSADTQYQLFVTAVRQGKKARSPTVVFNTAELPTAAPAPATQSAAQAAPATGAATPAASSSAASAAASAVAGVTEPITSGGGGGGGAGRGLHVRGVEVGIVLLVLVVWVAAIALFFNRWGKIRMLLPYQPDYKEQLKVPGSAATSGGVSCTGQHQGGQACPQRYTLLPSG